MASVSITPYPGVAVVSVTGEFDCRYEVLLKGLVSDPARITQSQVVLDLSRVTFIDASALNSIVYCRRLVAARSAELSLVVPEGQALRVLRLFGFERILHIYPERESALLELANRRRPSTATA